MTYLTPSLRRALWIAAALVVTACAVAVNASHDPRARALAVGTTDPAIVPLTPARLWDSRPNGPTLDDRLSGTGRVAADATFAVQVAGRGGVPVDAAAVAINLTVVFPDAAGFATVFPCDKPRPNASVLNYAPGLVAPNNAVARVAGDGTICVFTSAGADFALDVGGYVPAGSPVVVLEPARYLDTRQPAATFDGAESGGGKSAAGNVVVLPVGGRGSIPANAAAVFVNVTAVDPEAAGFVTVFACGAMPTASALNYGPGDIMPNGVIAPLAPDGSLCLFSLATTHLVVDVTGYIPAGTDGITVTSGARLADTRPGAPTIDGTKPGAPARLTAGQTVEVPIAGRAGIPGDALAVLANLTIVDAADAGFATLFPCGTRPGSSTLNATSPGTVRANSALAALSPAGTICVFASTPADIIVDVNGWIEPTDTGADPDEPGPTTTTTPGQTTTTTTPPGDSCARDTSVPQPGDRTIDLLITGKVLLPNGQPDPDTGGHAVVRDRRSNVNAILGEASVNDAGFFLVGVNSRAVPADPGCRDYWIEICAPSCVFTDDVVPEQFAERDITGLVNEMLGLPDQDIDISNDPLEYVFVE